VGNDLQNERSNMSDDVKVQGKPMHEIRRLVAEDSARFQRLAEKWNDLTVAEQDLLVMLANSLAARQ
jgi:hypothetical protein